MSLYYPSGVAVDASGNLFIAVNNNGNGRIRKVTNTQGPTLALNNVTAANAGNYQLVVTGPDGSVTSSVATLIVATSPLVFRTVHNSDGNLALNFVSQPNSTNVVLCATNLSPPVVWQPLSTNMAGANGNWQYTDTNAANWRAGFLSFPHSLNLPSALCYVFRSQNWFQILRFSNHNGGFQFFVGLAVRWRFIGNIIYGDQRTWFAG